MFEALIVIGVVLFIGYVFVTRDLDDPDFLLDYCDRCSHAEDLHWWPGTDAKTTACTKCLDEQITTTWTAPETVTIPGGHPVPPLTRTGICDHSREWVNKPW